MMQCPVTGQACETPSLCGSQGCIMVEMSTPTDPNFQGRQAPPEMRKRDKIRRLMEKTKGRKV